MSAYLVSKETIDCLVLAAATYPGFRGHFQYVYRDKDGDRHLRRLSDNPSMESLSLLGQTLWEWNMDSLLARYPDTTEETWGYEEYEGPPTKLHDRLVVSLSTMQPVVDFEKPALMDVFGCIRCLEYQSCEAEDWDLAEGHSILRAIEQEAIRQIPGYADAPWGLDSKEEVVS
jgi:hypothetical protein